MYIGSNQIKEIKDTTVIFEDGTQQTYTKKALIYLVTEEPLDASELQILVAEKVGLEIIGILEEHDVELSNIGKIFQRVQWGIEDSQVTMVAKAMGVYKEGESANETKSKLRLSNYKQLLKH